MPLDDDLQRRIREYRRFLEGLGPQGRLDFVDAARRNEDWPAPAARWLAFHAAKHGRGRLPHAYAQWAFDIKNRPGTYVYAYIHAAYRNCGLAFVDAADDVIVHFDCDQNLNFDCYSPNNGTKRTMRDHTAQGTHWRLRDTER